MNAFTNRLITSRLELIPATVALLRAKIDCGEPFFRLLGVEPVDDWPPVDTADALPFFLEQMQRIPKMERWLAWYWIFPGKRREESILVGNGGFKGPPDSDGVVEIGYYVRPTHRRRGYATEAVRCLVEHAFSCTGVKVVVAETQGDNAASLRLLENVGFVLTGEGSELGLLRFALAR